MEIDLNVGIYQYEEFRESLKERNSFLVYKNHNHRVNFRQICELQREFKRIYVFEKLKYVYDETLGS